MTVYLNGSFVPRAEARVPVDDRGFVFGDGVYEVIRAHDGHWFQAGPHLERLQRGLAGLQIAASSDTASDALLHIAERLLDTNQLRQGHATVYLQVTRGAAPRTHHFPPAGTPPTVFVAVAPLALKTEQCEQGGAAITHPDQRWARCDLKTVNLLPNVLAKQAAVAAGAVEAVLIRDDGTVTEGSHSTVFAVLNGVLRTHPLGTRILPGITRDVLITLAAEQGIPVREEALHAEQLEQVTELFICGTTTDVTPVIRLDGRPVADGRPGPVSRALYQALTAQITGAAPAKAGRSAARPA